MSLTPEQRQSLDWMAESLTLRPLDRAALAAALADLDACRAALKMIRDELNNESHPHAPDLARLVCEADAVLAAAGEEQQT